MRVFPNSNAKQAFSRIPQSTFIGLIIFGLLGLSSCVPNPQASPIAHKTKATASSEQTLVKAHEHYEAGLQAFVKRDLQTMEIQFTAAMDSFWNAGAKDSAFLAASKQIAACVYQYSSDRAILTHKRFASHFASADTSMAKAKLLNNASAAYSSLFQDPQALELLKMGREIHYNRIVAGIDSGIGGKLLSDNYNNQGLILYRVGTELKEVGFAERAVLKLEEGLAKFDTAANIFEDFGILQSPSQKAAQLNNRGLVLMALEEYSQSMKYFDQAYELENAMPEPNPYYATNYQYDKALALLSQESFPEAIQLFEQTKAIYQQMFGPADLQLFEAYALLAKAYLQTQQYEKALQNCQQALTCYSFGNTNYQDTWQNPSIDEVLVRVELLELFTYKLQALYHLVDSEDFQSVEQVLPTYELAFQVLEQLKANAYSETASYFISFYSSEILKTYLGFAERFPSLVPQAYQQVDNNRASYLMQGITLSRLQSINSLPDSLKEQEAALNNEINQLSLNRILFSKWGPEYAPYVSELEAQLSTSIALKAKFEDQIQSEHPAYYRLRYASPDAFGQAQNLLQKDQALLEYFIGDSTIYTFKIDDAGLSLFSCKRDSVFAWINAMTGDSILDPESTEPESAFLPYTYKLYDRLLAPILSELDSNYNRLVIIPDGEIASLPFGMLSRKDVPIGTGYREIPFLMKDFAIGYGYSTSSFAMQKEQYNNQSLPEGSLLAIAPDFPEREKETDQKTFRSVATDSSLYKLKFNETEINQIKIPAKKSLKGDNANPENFLELWNQYQYIHLATHAISNQSFPDEAAIAFSHEDGQIPMLRIKDLPNEPWHAKMLVLSACQTAAGQQVTGEGIISLARGFALKGIQSIIATQWSVGDLPSSQLMADYYGNLQQGMPKDIALQKAQISLVKGGGDRQYEHAHPLYWAAFSLYGDSSPVDFPDRGLPWLAVFIGLASLGLGWGLWRRFRK